MNRLPRVAQYAIALATVFLVGGVAWLVGRDRPVPDWVTDRLVPGLGVGYLVLVCIVLIDRLWRRRGGP